MIFTVLNQFYPFFFYHKCFNLFIILKYCHIILKITIIILSNSMRKRFFFFFFPEVTVKGKFVTLPHQIYSLLSNYIYKVTVPLSTNTLIAIEQSPHKGNRTIKDIGRLVLKLTGRDINHQCLIKVQIGLKGKDNIGFGWE